MNACEQNPCPLGDLGSLLCVLKELYKVKQHFDLTKQSADNLEVTKLDNTREEDLYLKRLPKKWPVYIRLVCVCRCCYKYGFGSRGGIWGYVSVINEK